MKTLSAGKYVIGCPSLLLDNVGIINGQAKSSETPTNESFTGFVKFALFETKAKGSKNIFEASENILLSVSTNMIGAFPLNMCNQEKFSKALESGSVFVFDSFYDIECEISEYGNILFNEFIVDTSKSL